MELFMSRFLKNKFLSSALRRVNQALRAGMRNMAFVGLSVVGMSALMTHCSLFPEPGASVPGAPLPSSCRQVIVAIPADWNSSRTTLHVLEKTDKGWTPIMEPIPARLGKSGLVWGLGVNPVPHGLTLKKEGDWRTPAGIFALDRTIYAYDAELPKHEGFALHKVTPYDLWVEDPKSPLYNHHLVVKHIPSTPWETSQQMKQDDPSHAIKWFILHNAPGTVEGRPVSGAGSSIFFHIWRDNGARPTAGCTSMSEDNIKKLVQIIDPEKNPMYVIFPKKEYELYKKSLNLP